MIRKEEELTTLECSSSYSWERVGEKKKRKEKNKINRGNQKKQKKHSLYHRFLWRQTLSHTGRRLLPSSSQWGLPLATIVPWLQQKHASILHNIQKNTQVIVICAIAYKSINWSYNLYKFDTPQIGDYWPQIRDLQPYQGQMPNIQENESFTNQNKNYKNTFICSLWRWNVNSILQHDSYIQV